MHSSFESVRECALAASAGMNLRFDDDIDIAEFARDLLRLVKGRRDSSWCRRYIEFLQQFFGLVFVNIHRQRAVLSGALSISGKAISLPRADQQRFSHNVLALVESSPLPSHS